MMMKNFILEQKNTALLVVDVQKKLLDMVEKPDAVLQNICKIVKAFQILDLPIFATEQYPKGLGSTEASLQALLGKEQKIYQKTTFSCAQDSEFFASVVNSSYKQFVLVGIEAHVCILQTVKDLISSKQIVVLQDATSSRNNVDYTSALDEIREIGARVSTVETVLFELLKDSKAQEFKQISNLIK